MEERAVLKRQTRDIEIELHCECEGTSFNTIWSPGSPWRIETSGKIPNPEKRFKEILYMFNTVKTKFDHIIRRLEREYRQFDKVVSDLPTIKEEGEIGINEC